MDGTIYNVENQNAFDHSMYVFHIPTKVYSFRVVLIPPLDSHVHQALLYIQ
jgi:hypothetical protein